MNNGDTQWRKLLGRRRRLPCAAVLGSFLTEAK